MKTAEEINERSLHLFLLCAAFPRVINFNQFLFFSTQCLLCVDVCVCVDVWLRLMLNSRVQLSASTITHTYAHIQCTVNHKRNDACAM